MHLAVVHQNRHLNEGVIQRGVHLAGAAAVSPQGVGAGDGGGLVARGFPVGADAVVHVELDPGLQHGAGKHGGGQVDVPVAALILQSADAHRVIGGHHADQVPHLGLVIGNHVHGVGDVVLGDVAGGAPVGGFIAPFPVRGLHADGGTGVDGFEDLGLFAAGSIVQDIGGVLHKGHGGIDDVAWNRARVGVDPVPFEQAVIEDVAGAPLVLGVAPVPLDMADDHLVVDADLGQGSAAAIGLGLQGGGLHRIGLVAPLEVRGLLLDALDFLLGDFGGFADDAPAGVIVADIRQVLAEHIACAPLRLHLAPLFPQLQDIDQIALVDLARAKVIQTGAPAHLQVRGGGSYILLPFGLGVSFLILSGESVGVVLDIGKLRSALGDKIHFLPKGKKRLAKKGQQQQGGKQAAGESGHGGSPSKQSARPQG